MTTMLYVLSGITDLLIIAFIFMAMYEFARKTKPNAITTLASGPLSVFS